MTPPARASQRFLDHRWLAEAEAKRAARRRIPLPYQELLAAARVGLWQADQRAPVGVDLDGFCRLARSRCRGAIVDALREATEGGRRGDKPNAWKPRLPAPGALAVAQAQGLVPLASLHQDAFDLIDPQPDPELQLVLNERHAERVRVLELIESLPPAKREVLMRRLLGERSLAIAASLGLSAPRVSQIQTEAVALLRKLAEE